MNMSSLCLAGVVVILVNLGSLYIAAVAVILENRKFSIYCWCCSYTCE